MNRKNTQAVQLPIQLSFHFHPLLFSLILSYLRGDVNTSFTHAFMVAETEILLTGFVGDDIIKKDIGYTYLLTVPGWLNCAVAERKPGIGSARRVCRKTNNK